MEIARRGLVFADRRAPFVERPSNGKKSEIRLGHLLPLGIGRFSDRMSLFGEKKRRRVSEGKL